MKKKVLIEGMSCGNCARHTKEALEELNGVTYVEVNLAEKYALVDASQDVNDEDIRRAIDDAGYEVISVEVV